MLIFLTKTGITSTKSAATGKNTCPTYELDTDQLEINVIPINFRNADDNNQNYRQMFMQLSVNETVRTCMNENKFNLTVVLDQSVQGNEIKVGSIATKHIINVGEEHLEILSCKFRDNQVSDKDVIKFLELINSFDSKGNKDVDSSQELVFFMGSSEFGNIKNIINHIQISFGDKGQNKMCDYRGCLEILT